MEYTQINGTDIQVSRLCVGGCPMGGHGWGDVSRGEMIAAVHAALDSGVNFFDTADIYGMGEAEKTLGTALRDRRHDAIINAKFGVRRSSDGTTFYDNSPDWIPKALEATLQRLKTDYVDMYQVHYRDDMTSLSAVVEVLERLKGQGKIRSYGLSNIFDEDRAELRSIDQHICSFQNEYSLAKRIHEDDILGLSQEFSMTPMTWGSLGQGILTGKYNADSRFGDNDRRSRAIYKSFHGERLVQNLLIVEEMRLISEVHRVSVASVAIRWILDRIPGSVVIAGVKNPPQLAGNVAALGWSLEQSEMELLDRISLSRG